MISSIPFCEDGKDHVMTQITEEMWKYGILRPDATGPDGLIAVNGLVEKPKCDQASSRLASFGRYVFTPEVFDMLHRLKPGAGGAIQLADAIDQLGSADKVAAITNPSQCYDCGSKFGYLTAIADHTLAHPEYRVPFLDLLCARLAGMRSPDPRA